MYPCSNIRQLYIFSTQRVVFMLLTITTINGYFSIQHELIFCNGKDWVFCDVGIVVV
jgi:hypothetical protein